MSKKAKLKKELESTPMVPSEMFNRSDFKYIDRFLPVSKNIDDSITIKITVSTLDIKNSGVGKNQFNGEVMYNEEKYKVQDALDFFKKEWSDIISYDYIIGLRQPLHMGECLATRKAETVVDGYNVWIRIKEDE
jgi:hypothetical protein